jgi:hypothetical protein
MRKGQEMCLFLFVRDRVETCMHVRWMRREANMNSHVVGVDAG